MKKKPIYIAIVLLSGMVVLFSQALAYAPRITTASVIQQEETVSADEKEEIEEPEETEAPEIENDQDNQPGKGNQGNPGKGNKHPGRKYNFKGTVISFSETALSLTDKNGLVVNIKIDSNTDIKFTGPKATAGATIQKDEWVIARTVKDTDGSYLAIQVHVLTGKPMRVHRVGEVTDYLPGSSITVQDKKGGSTTFEVTGDTKILPIERKDSLGPGSWVTVICPRDPVNGTLKAIGIVVHPEKDGNQ